MFRYNIKMPKLESAKATKFCSDAQHYYGKIAILGNKSLVLIILMSNVQTHWKMRTFMKPLKILVRKVCNTILEIVADAINDNF